MEDGPAKQNARAVYLPRLDNGASVEEGYDKEDLVSLAALPDEFSGLEPHSVSIAPYASGETIEYLDSETRRKTR